MAKSSAWRGTPAYLRARDRAGELGYASVAEAITGMRKGGYRWGEIAAELGMGRQALRALLARVARGEPERGQQSGGRPSAVGKSCECCEQIEACRASLRQRGPILCGEVEVEVGLESERKRGRPAHGWHVGGAGRERAGVGSNDGTWESEWPFRRGHVVRDPDASDQA
jgi:hypothetical protein